MKKFLNKAKSALDDFGNDGPHPPADQQQVPTHDGASDGPPHIQSPTRADVIRYRYHHGTNLGSIFIQEKWLTGSMHHKSAPGSSELTAVETWVKVEGIEKTRERFERHWRDYTSDADLDWLRDVARCTTIRLPIGYFSLGPPYCEHTPFKNVKDVYQNSWQCVRDLIKRCNARGIGVVIDLHGLPGGANKGDHSGTNSGKPEFWTSSKNRSLATRCVCFIAQQVKSMEGVAGVQIVNESEYDAPKMYEWYGEVLQETAKIDHTMPIYISDGWDLGRCAGWTRDRNSLRCRNENPVVIDTHLYWCFNDADKSTLR